MRFVSRLALSLCALILTGAPIQAQTNEDVSDSQGTRSNSALASVTGPIPQFDLPPIGAVEAIVQSNSTIYVGGDFSYVGERFGPVIRINKDVEVDRAFAQQNTIFGTFTSDELGRKYGLSSSGVSRVRADGSVDTTWNPDLQGLSGLFRTMVATAQYVYVGGSFTFTDGPNTGLKDLIAIDATTGAIVRTWNPLKNTEFGSVRSLAVYNDHLFIGMTVYGDANGISPLLIQVDRTTGARIRWETGLVGKNGGDVISNMRVIDSVLVVSGTFHVGEDMRHVTAFQLKPHTNPGVLPNFPDSPVEPWTIAQDGDKIHLFEAMRPKGFYETILSFKSVEVSTGAVNPWSLTMPNQDLGLHIASFVVTGNQAMFYRSYETGSFTRHAIVRYDITTGQRIGSSVMLNERVEHMYLLDGSIYISGMVTSIGGLSRNGVAAYDRSTGKLKDWNPDLNSAASGPIVTSLALYKEGVVIGGRFTEVEGERKFGVVIVDQDTGYMYDWAAGMEYIGSVSAILVEKDTLYIAGDIRFGPHDERGYGIAAFNLAIYDSIPMDWRPIRNGSGFLFTKLMLHDNKLYAVGRFQVDEPARHGAIAIDVPTGTILPWNPEGLEAGFDIAFGGSTAFISGIFADGDGNYDYVDEVTLDTGKRTPWDVAIQNVDDPMRDPVVINTVAVDETTIYLGGIFNRVNGEKKRTVVLLSRATGEIIPFDLDITGQPTTFDLKGRSLVMTGYLSTIDGKASPSIATVDLAAHSGTAQMIGMYSAAFHGMVHPDGKTVSTKFVLTREQGNYTDAITVMPEQSSYTASAPQVVRATVNNLKPAVYYYRMVSTGPDGTFYGNEFMLDARLKTFLPFLRR